MITAADFAALPVTLNTGQAAEMLGVSRDHLWKLAREGRAPIEPLRLGATLRWPTALLADLLGLGSGARDSAGLEGPALASTPSPEGETG